MTIEPKKTIATHDDFMKRADELLKEIEDAAKEFIATSDAGLVQLREATEEAEDTVYSLGRDFKKIEHEGLKKLNKTLHAA